MSSLTEERHELALKRGSREQMELLLPQRTDCQFFLPDNKHTIPTAGEALTFCFCTSEYYRGPFVNGIVLSEHRGGCSQILNTYQGLLLPLCAPVFLHLTLSSTKIETRS